MPRKNIPHVVIVGGGFGGLYAARALARAKVRITLIDRRNHHLFQPLLYQVATAGLSPGDIAQPIRRILRGQRNVTVIMAEVKSVDAKSRQVVLADGDPLTYDHLILATGATHAYFGHEEWAHRAPGLKTLEDAVTIRRQFLTAFERAERETDKDKRKALLTFVIVGAGPTGVELAGTMSEMAQRALPKEYRRIPKKIARILLLEGGPRVLAAYPERLSKSAQRQLEKLGVEVRTSAMVTKLDDKAVYVGDERLEAASVFWAAGVAASPLGATLGVPLDSAGRVKVAPDLSIPGHPEILVVGDLATLVDAKGKAVPGVAPAAIQMGVYAATRIKDSLRGRKTTPFAYWDKGSLATIGRAAAVGMIGPFRLSGWAAWLAWLLIHLYFIIGFRNRLLILLKWLWAYLDFFYGARLITTYDSRR